MARFGGDHAPRLMDITERSVGDVHVLDVHGRMTRSEGYGAIKEKVSQLAAAGGRRVLVNLADVPYMDSTCVGELVSAFITIRNQGGTLKLVGATSRVQELISIAKLDTVFDVFETEDQAVASFT